VTLAETQALLAALLRGEGPGALGGRPLFSGRSAADADRRIDLYRSLNSGKVAAELGQRFPKTSELLGEALFAQATRAYFARPLAGAPVWSGWESLLSDFPAFLRASAERWGRPDVADVARLDLAREEISQEAVVEPVGPDALSRFGPAEVGRATLRFIPALRVLRLAHDVLGFWRKKAKEPPPQQPGPITLIVWRRALTIFLSRLGPCEAEALQRARTGAPLAQVFEAFRGEQDPSQRAYTALRTWLEDGLVAALERKS
jgi:hypothetical protein